MNNVKSIFSIKDLENLSGIKAHTIRIWEKRYKVLEPMRTDTNIRLYDVTNLQKLLNITLLHNHGYKISKIATFSVEKIPQIVSDIVSDKSAKHHAISSFKMAMMNFDYAHFTNTYNSLLLEKSFREVFYDVFIPLIEEIGILWQTNTITPAHEHFISFLIKQKILTNTEKIQITEPKSSDRVFVLYLPMNEIHELGLMYLNYEILSLGYRTVYLGESVPIENLKDLKQIFDNITYVCYMTVEPNKENLNGYIAQIKDDILTESSNFWVIGRMSENINPSLLSLLSEKITTFSSIKELVNSI